MQDSNRIVFSLVLIAIITIAAISVGYAYTAMTTNSENNADAEYITLTQDGIAAYTFTADDCKVYWDSKNTGEWVDGDSDPATPSVIKRTTKYTISDNTVDITVNSTDYKAVKLSRAPIELNAVPTGTITNPLNCSFVTTNFISTTGAVFIVGISDDESMTSPTYSIMTDNDSWSDNQFTIATSGSGYADKFIEVYYGYTGEGVISIDGVSPPPTQVLNDATIKFIARTPSLNGVVTQLTNVTITGSPSVAVGGSESLSTNQTGGNWTSLNTDKATVDSSSGAVSGVAAGKAYIVYTYGSGDNILTDCFEITVS